MKKIVTSLLAAVIGTQMAGSLFAAPQAIEIGPENVHLLPKGKEADGIQGDFVLKNNRVEALISGNLPFRKANMGTFWDAIAVGCLFDFTFVGEPNDQLTVFSPGNQQGPVSYVRIVKDGSDGEAVIETVITAARNNGIYERIEYILADDTQSILIRTTYENQGRTKSTISIPDRLTSFLSTGKVNDITWADAVNPADKLGYAYGWDLGAGQAPPPEKLELEPGASKTFGRWLAVGRSPVEAVGIIESKRGETATVAGRIVGPDNKGLAESKLEIMRDGKNIPAYPDANGAFQFRIAPGEYEFEASEIGRSSTRKKLALKANESSQADFTLGPATFVSFDIQDEKGRSLPCKAQFIGINGTSSPKLGPANRAHGCLDQYFSEKGQFRVQLPPGKYRVIVTHGNEFSYLEQTIELEESKSTEMKGILRRLVDTRGWISADFHNHSTPSGDNTCGTDDRIISLAVENVEFAPTTEHNRFYDWQPHIQKLGLTNELATIPGIELTGSGAHFNSFPFHPHPHEQDGGAPQWHKDPRVTAMILRDFQGHNPDRWLQINHPDMIENFVDRNGDGEEDGGYFPLEVMIDGAESWGEGILAKEPFYFGPNREGKETLFYRREFIWLQLLNRGHAYTCVAVSDAHSIHGNGVGGWRMYVPSSTDDPARIDWREIVRNSKAGKAIVTTGPFLEVSAEDGTIAGGTTKPSGGKVRLKVKVQCTDWLDIDRVQILVNGRQPEKLNFTRASHRDWFQDGVVKFDRTIEIPVAQDSHLIVVAFGEKFDLSKGFGSSLQGKWKPCAYNNPVYVDVDGHGFRPNYDSLDWPLPPRYTPDQARELLRSRKEPKP